MRACSCARARFTPPQTTARAATPPTTTRQQTPTQTQKHRNTQKLVAKPAGERYAGVSTSFECAVQGVCNRMHHAGGRFAEAVLRAHGSKKGKTPWPGGPMDKASAHGVGIAGSSPAEVNCQPAQRWEANISRTPQYIADYQLPHPRTSSRASVGQTPTKRLQRMCLCLRSVVGPT